MESSEQPKNYTDLISVNPLPSMHLNNIDYIHNISHHHEPIIHQQLTTTDYTQLQHQHPHQLPSQPPPHQDPAELIYQQNLQLLDTSTTNSPVATTSKKRKTSHAEYSDDEYRTDCSKVNRGGDEGRKQNHSEIEKRRRDKMNTYIMELQTMIPMCHAMSRKLDKLTVLRMAVQHLKQIRGSANAYTEGFFKPTFLSDEELKMLILQAAEGFLFVVGCDRGKILYVSESVTNVLNCTQSDLLGQSWFDILHPKDVAKVKEQLSSPDLSPRERFIDAKTMLPVKTDIPSELPRLCPGARRSFFCRMKFKSQSLVKDESDTSSSSQSSNKRKSKINSDKRYKNILCTGYLKSWNSLLSNEEDSGRDVDGDSSDSSCLVAVGRIPPDVLNANCTSLEIRPRICQIQFLSRHALDGKFLFIDQRATLVLGFLPQELLGTSMYEYFHNEDISALAESHKIALQNNEEITTPVYRFRTKSNSFVRLQSEWKSFKNPWTKEIDYLMAKNAVYLVNSTAADGSVPQTDAASMDFFTQSNGRDMQRIITNHVEASKIGRQIAEQVLTFHKRMNDSSSENSPDHEEPCTSSSLLNKPDDSIEHMQNEPSTSNIMRPPNTIPSTSRLPETIVINPEVFPMPSTSSMDVSMSTNTHDGGDEATMAAILSLIDSDAELQNSVDFSNLQWPLP